MSFVHSAAQNAFDTVMQASRQQTASASPGSPLTFKTKPRGSKVDSDPRSAPSAPKHQPPLNLKRPGYDALGVAMKAGVVVEEAIERRKKDLQIGRQGLHQELANKLSDITASLQL